MGHSMGGYGALNAAMKHPDVFGAVYAISPGLFDANGLSESQMFADEGMIPRFLDLQAKAAGAGQEKVSQLLAGAGGDLNFTAAYGLAFSPDPAQPALIAYPFKMENGKPMAERKGLGRLGKRLRRGRAGGAAVQGQLAEAEGHWRRLRHARRLQVDSEGLRLFRAADEGHGDPRHAQPARWRARGQAQRAHCGVHAARSSTNF